MGKKQMIYHQHIPQLFPSLQNHPVTEICSTWNPSPGIGGRRRELAREPRTQSLLRGNKEIPATIPPSRPSPAPVIPEGSDRLQGGWQHLRFFWSDLKAPGFIRALLLQAPHQTLSWRTESPRPEQRWLLGFPSGHQSSAVAFGPSGVV